MGSKSRKINLKYTEIKEDEDVFVEECKIGKKYTKLDKLSFIGPGKIDKGNGQLLDVVKIKNELYQLSHTEAGCRKVLNKYQGYMSDRAYGANIAYGKKIVNTKHGSKEVLVKLPFMSNVKWAQDMDKKGGGGTAYSIIERLVLIAAVYICSLYWKELKMDIKLGIFAVGNIGKVFRIYIVIMVITEYGLKYEAYVSHRSNASIRKRLVWSMNKKNMHPDAITIRSILSEFAAPESVVQNSYLNMFLFT